MRKGLRRHMSLREGYIHCILLEVHMYVSILKALVSSAREHLMLCKLVSQEPQTISGLTVEPGSCVLTYDMRKK